MKKLYPFTVVLAVPVILLVLSFSSGSQGGYTGSTGDGGLNCTSCHSGSSPNTVEDWITSNIPEGGYLPGQTYEITASGTHPGVALFGFELTAEDESGNPLGIFSIIDPTQTQLTGSNDKSVTHTSGGTTPVGDSKSWTVNWTAPEEAGAKDVYFYAALNAANGNGSNQGDIIYLTSKMFDVSFASIAEARLDEISIYPVPCINEVSIGLSGDFFTDYRLISTDGRTLTGGIIQSDRFTLDMTGYPPGVYYVRFIRGDFSGTRRIVLL